MNFDLSEFTHKISLKVRYGDLDPMGHVNNVTYLRYLEEARLAFIQEIYELSPQSLDFGGIVARIEIDYLKPLERGDDILAHSRVIRIGNKSYGVETLLVLGNDPVAVGTTTMVTYDYDIQKAIPIPEKIRVRLQQF